MESVRRLREVIRPLVLRRTKAEVARDLPARIVVERECDLPQTQKALYQQVLTQIEFVEQPVKAADLAGLKFVADRTNIPVLADEAVFGFEDALQVLTSGSADIVNIKLMKTGGLSQAIEIANLARRMHRPVMIGCMLEGVISVTAAAHLAVAFSDVITLLDLDGPQVCAEQVVKGGLAMNVPWIELPEWPGLGIVSVDGFEHPQHYEGPSA